MSIKVDKYCARAIIRYLNGDRNLFYTYVRKAMELYEQKKEFIAIEDLIDTKTKNRLYEMVS